MDRSEFNSSLVDGLIAQDTQISETQLKEFRMKLNQSLERLEQTAEASRTALIRSVGAVFVCYIFGFVFNLTREYSALPYHIIGPAWSICTNVALVTMTVIAVRYWSRHRPALERGRTDLQIAMFSELQRQVAELTQRVDSTGK